MITGTIDVYSYVVDYCYYFTPGDAFHSNHEKIVIRGIYEVIEQDGKYASVEVKEVNLSMSVRQRIYTRCSRDGMNQAIPSNRSTKTINF